MVVDTDIIKSLLRDLAPKQSDTTRENQVPAKSSIVEGLSRQQVVHSTYSKTGRDMIANLSRRLFKQRSDLTHTCRLSATLGAKKKNYCFPSTH
jgi:hypothetical protein